MKLNTMQNFWQKGIHSPFWILASRGQNSQKAPTHPMKNFAFWMELNTPIKNLACISHSKVVGILYFTFHGEVNTV
jgi:hypothetical protein